MNKVEVTKDYALKGLLAILSANIIWGVSDVCIKIIGRGQLVTCILGFSGFLLLIAAQLFMRRKFSVKDFLKSFPIGLQRSIIWGGLFIAFQKDNPAIAATIFSFSLVVAVVAFGPLLGEKITSRILIFSFVGVIGVILTANESFSDMKFSTSSLIVLALLPLSAAGTYLLRDLQKKVPAETAATYYFLWVGILMLPVALLTNPRYEFSTHELLVVAAMAATGAGGHFLYSVSQKSTTFQFNAIASSVHSPSTALCAWLFLGSKLALHQWVGMVIVIAVVAYISIATKKPEVQVLEESLSPEI